MSEDVTHYRLQAMENAVMELRTAHKSIAESLQQLVLLERAHAETRDAITRAWKQIELNAESIRAVDDQIPERLAERLRAVESDLPMLRKTSGWVTTALLAAAAATGVLVWKTATEPHRHDYEPAVDPRPVPTEPVRGH